ncbi:hypothetical protein MYCTH_2296363 [Thermothelomyces thermophilus ATCC 42464]|uniref:Uncharacterized protein n=1 Tax=Thermothelomyces thermophilus (strain ATCC 42464 / BCRC 31852 / DSM 1799) TaxID=573729 RepID=G2Q1F7_THET4|nr:uncharacterized protein MYCTH_2296363 [Thermothelomyces thermophilus ATCC 42464]AEO54147.1 hypothetical protein MYCTH_2296363 [Thermothelomyces thermophilus ATCC 42464]
MTDRVVQNYSHTTAQQRRGSSEARSHRPDGQPTGQRATGARRSRSRNLVHSAGDCEIN